MRVKNLAGATMNFPGGFSISPGETVSIPDAAWNFLQHNLKIKTWIAANLVELNGTIPPEVIPTIPALEGGVVGRVVILANQAAYNALSSPRSDTLYTWPGA